MAAVTVIKFFLTFALGYMIYEILGPLVKTTRYDTGQWSNMPTSVLVFGDNEYSIWILFIVIIAGVLILTAWREAERRAAEQV